MVFGWPIGLTGFLLDRLEAILFQGDQIALEREVEDRLLVGDVLGDVGLVGNGLALRPANS
jgi:hypothetical protein